MLKSETFSKGMTILETCCKGFELNAEEAETWYQIIKTVIDDDAFLPLVLNYCKSESAPTCPADLIKFARKMLTDTAPSPAFVADALFEAVDSMIHDYDFIYSDPSQEDIQEYIVTALIGRNVLFRRDDIHVVLVTLVKDYSGALVKTVRHNNSTEISILTSEIKSSYRNTLNRTVSRSVISVNALEGSNPLLLE